MRIPDRFNKAYQKIKELQSYDRYVSALIFGSFARGETTAKSDLDVMVVVKDGQTSCTQINHPIIGGVKLDISFKPLGDVEKQTEEELRNLERVPIMGESVIVFDKDGQLMKLRNRALRVKPKKLLRKNHQWIQFMIYHTNEKVERFLEVDTLASLFTMTTGIEEVLKMHYKINRKWWVSNKRLLQDMGNWDPKMASLLKKFISTSKVDEKFDYWRRIIDYVLKPLGGRRLISENNCNCKICNKDLLLLNS